MVLCSAVLVVSVVRIRGCTLASLGVCIGFHFIVLNIRSHRYVTSVVSINFKCGVILVCHGTLCWSAVVRRHQFLLNRHRDIFQHRLLDYLTYTMELHLIALVDMNFVET